MKLTKREMPSGDGQGGLFLKFKDGESKVGVPRGEVYEFKQKWANNKSQVVGADDPEGKSRFRINFVLKEGDELKAKIFEFGLTVYNQLAEIAEDYDITQTALKITRRGLGTDTIYMVTPVPPKQQPVGKVLAAIEAIPMNILEHKPSVASVTNSMSSAESFDEDSEIPF